MSKERIELSLDPEIIQKMRTDAIKKYGNLRSVSKLIEEIYTHKDQGMDRIGNLDPDILRSKIHNALLILTDIEKVKKSPKGKERCKEAVADLLEINTVVLQGLCDRTLRSKVWCPNCEGYYRVPKLGNKYFDIDENQDKGYEFEADEKIVCSIPTDSERKVV